jgi:hypothetical protein
MHLMVRVPYRNPIATALAPLSLLTTAERLANVVGRGREVGGVNSAE